MVNRRRRETVSSGGSNKSAKDRAFEKERVKFRREIRELSSEVNEERKEICRLYEIIREKDEQIRQKDEWIERLLAYTEMTKEDLQSLIESEKAKADVAEKLNGIVGVGLGKGFSHLFF